MSDKVFEGTRVLITGASSGLGEEFAQQLATLGATHLVLTARRAARLDKVKDLLRDLYPACKVDCVSADLSIPSGVDKLMLELDSRGFEPQVLINNAGFGDLGMFESSDQSKIDSMIMVNVMALTKLTRWVLPKMLDSKLGWICNVGSTAGMMQMLPTFAVYAATKAYVNSFSEALRIECLGSGVKVSVLAPGPVETEFGAVAEREGSSRRFEAPDFFMVHKATVVDQALKGLATNQARVVPGFSVRFGSLWLEMLPTWLIRTVMSTQAGTFQKERQERKQKGLKH